MNFNLTNGSIVKPQRVLIYGPEGIGKSTLAAAMPNPVFIDIEQGTSQLEVMRIDTPTTWQMLLEEVRYITANVPQAGTIVIDTADAAERLCQHAVCIKRDKRNIEDFGYGKGYVYAMEEFNQLLLALNASIEAGINVVIIAHSQMRKFERPDEAGAYDRYELKLDKRVATLVKEWADAVLFCDYETFVSRDESGRAKASGGKRVVRTNHHPVWDAKNRWGLPDKIALDDEGYNLIREHLISRNAKSAYDQLTELMDASGISVTEVEDVCAAKAPTKFMDEWPESYTAALIKAWPRLKDTILAKRNAQKIADIEQAAQAAENN